MCLLSVISGATWRWATCRACVTCWLLSWSSWTTVSQQFHYSATMCLHLACQTTVCIDTTPEAVSSPPTLCCYGSPEAMAFSCFTQLMKRMNHNFPHGGAMDTHFANMRSLIQVKSAVPHTWCPGSCALRAVSLSWSHVCG
jgi:hypothetical protein